MANHIAEVAKMLGVKIGETFKLTDDTHGDYHQYYQFTDKKGFETSLDGVKWKTAAAEVLSFNAVNGIRRRTTQMGRACQGLGVPRFQCRKRH